jgi:RNA polymerase sigma-70 factor, ECF subfamily
MHMDTLDHETLIMYLENADLKLKEAAFQQLFYELYERELKYAYFLLDDMEDARDVAQLTFQQFWELSRYKHIKPFGGYIRKMCHTNCLRVLKERASVQSKQKDLFRATPTFERATFDQSPELKVAIDEAIASLRPSHRRAFQLYYMHNMNQKEASEMMGITPQVFKNYVHLAVVNLRIRLSGFFNL